jgi:hypothetical protein
VRVGAQDAGLDVDDLGDRGRLVEREVVVVVDDRGPAARLATASSTVWSAVWTGAPFRSGVIAASMSTGAYESLMT